ncbi:MAG: LPS assembly lipoprotein LptE [Polaromonas sp.]|nr:LPS assembly lipoprotein LptE [Polaromonas sp.]
MQRRSLLTLAAAGAVLALTGCGFELRKAPNFAFGSLFSPLGENSPVGVELKRLLQYGDRVRVITDPRQINTADVILDVLGDKRERVVVGLNASGQVREFQLRLTFRFKLRTPQGKELIPDTEVVQQRDLSYSESAALAKESEEALLYRDMERDIVQQISRRLAAVQSL